MDWKEGGREDRGSEGAMEGGRERGREGERERGRIERGREGGREGGREKGWDFLPPPARIPPKKLKLLCHNCL